MKSFASSTFFPYKSPCSVPAVGKSRLVIILCIIILVFLPLLKGVTVYNCFATSTSAPSASQVKSSVLSLLSFHTVHFGL